MSVIGLMIAIFVSPTIQTASIGIPDTMFLMVLALIVFGPRRLPEIGRQIGKLMYEFRKVSNDFKFQMEEELRASEEAERQQKLEASRAITLEASTQPAVSSTTPVAAITDGSALVEPPLIESAGSETWQAETLDTGIPDHLSNVESDMSSGLVEPAQDKTSQASEAVEVSEVRGEPRRFPPQVRPPAGIEPVAAARPFRPRSEELVEGVRSDAEAGATNAASEPVDIWGAPIKNGHMGSNTEIAGMSSAMTASEAGTAESEQEAKHA